VNLVVTTHTEQHQQMYKNVVNAQVEADRGSNVIGFAAVNDSARVIQNETGHQ
jgi:hypothetical protein